MLDVSIQKNLDKIKQSTLVFDIETSAKYPDGRPIDIKGDFNNYLRWARVKWFGAYSYKYNQEYYLNAQTDTKQILSLLNDHRVLVGFNSEEFDYPILVNNGFAQEGDKPCHVDCFSILGTVNFKNRSGYANKNRGQLMDYKFKSNSLRCMAETMKLEYLKGDIDFKIFYKDSWTLEEIIEIKKYLRNDVMATKELFEKLWNYWLPFAELLDLKNVYDLSWIKNSIASLTYKAACRIINTDPTYAEKEEVSEEMGGNVFEPQIEEAYGVWYVDFSSLYPHMFTCFNLPAEISPDSIGNRKVWHGNEVFQVRGYYDITSWHPLSKYIAGKLKERIHLKETDPKNPMVYTLKIFLNGLYGIFRSPIFEKIHTPNCGWDCCWLGQQTQQLTKEMLEQFGFKIIYGDTDSLFFLTDNKEINNRDYVVDCLNQIINIIKDNMPFPVDTFKIGIENYLEYIMFPFEDAPIIGEDGENKKENNRLIKERKGKKKNYVMLYKEKDEYKVKLVGLPIIKDNATALGIKIYEEVLKDKIIQVQRAKFPKVVLETIVNDYLKKPEIMDLVSIEYKVNTCSSYKNASQIQAQISKAYFDGNDGVIKLIKNTKIGKVGKGLKYCTIQEALDSKLKVEDLDLDKLWNELEPFVEYKEPIKVACEILAKDDKALTELAEAYLEEKEEVKKKRGRPRKVLTVEQAHDLLYDAESQLEEAWKREENK